MRNGFTFKNRHSGEFGLTVKTKSRPIRPAVKRYAVDMPYRDGEYDFSASNPQGREHYESRIFTVTLGIFADSLELLQERISEVSLWLTGGGELVFDDIPLVVWHGSVFDEVIYMPENGGKKTVIDVAFRVKPFGSCAFGTEGIEIGMPLPIGSGLPLNISERYKKTFVSETDIDMINFGDRPVRPVISISGGAKRVNMSLGDKTLTFTATGDATVDFDKQTVKCGGENINVTSEFFEFPSGKSLLHVTNSTSNTLVLKVSFKPEFMYGAVFDGNIWGGEYA